MALPSNYGIDKRINSMEGLSAYENGGKGSGNFGHAGRPGEVGGSAPEGSSPSDKLHEIQKSITGQKKYQDAAEVVRKTIEDTIGQKVKEGEEYSALDEAGNARFKQFHGEDGTEYTYDKENGMITKTNPKTGDQEVVTKGDGKSKQSNPREGYGSRFSKASIDDDDYTLGNIGSDGKTVESRLDSESMRDTITARAVAKQIGEQIYQDKLGNISDKLSREYVLAQRQIASRIQDISAEIIDGAGHKLGKDYADKVKQKAEYEMSKLYSEMKTYDYALTEYGDKVYKGVSSSQAKMLKENDKALQRAQEKLEKAYKKYVDSMDNEPSIKTDISDLTRKRK